MKLKSIKQIKNLKGKTVFLRADFNVAIKGNKIFEDYRIDRTLPTIKFLLKNKCKVIIGTHLGRPEGEWSAKYTLKPVVALLKKKIKGTSVSFIPEKFNEQLVRQVKKSRSAVIVLENLRFHAGEEKNDLQFAKYLASMADIYVNDAFAVCHRSGASLTGITNFLPSYAGLNLMAEVEYLSKAMKPQGKAVAFIGGIKLDSKFGVISNFLKKYEKIYVGGGVANTILKARGYDIGESLYDKKYLSAAKSLSPKKVIVPVDFVVVDKNDHCKMRYQKLEWGKVLCGPGEQILDVGMETIGQIMKQSSRVKTMVWGGPFGLIDEPPFEKASVMLAKVIAGITKKNKAISIVGGGETIASVNMAKVGKKISFISTGGGAMLEFLEGKDLPAIKALQTKKL